MGSKAEVKKAEVREQAYYKQQRAYKPTIKGSMGSKTQIT